MLEGSHGEVFVADSGGGEESAAVGSPASRAKDGIVYVMPAGQASARRKLIEHLDRPYGLALWKNYLYVAETESIKRYPYDSKTLQVAAGEEVISLAGLARGHWTRSLLFDRSGDKLYVGVGSASNVDTGEDPRRPRSIGTTLMAAGTRSSPTARGIRSVCTDIRIRTRCGQPCRNVMSSATICHRTISHIFRNTDSTAGRTPTWDRMKIHG
jgi:glucose/arabinose dehydrogenase